MKVYGLEVMSYGFNFGPSRSQVISHLNSAVNNCGATDLLKDGEKSPLKQKVGICIKTYGFDAIIIDAVRGSHLSYTQEAASYF